MIVAPSDTIKRVSLHDELVSRLRTLILDGDMAPGSRVPEKALCERFGVSRTPMREALKVLASEGLLELLPQRGATVAKLTLSDIEDMFPVVSALEGLAGELACERVSDEEIAAIEALHHDMIDAYRRHDRPRYFFLNRQIHERLLDTTQNAVLIATYRGLAGRIRNARYMANMSQPSWAQAIKDHEHILDALRQRDGKRLSTLLREHLKNKYETVKASLVVA